MQFLIMTFEDVAPAIGVYLGLAIIFCAGFGLAFALGRAAE
jgi:hypothetical protein